MDSYICKSFRVLLILSLLCLQSRADGSGSVFFIDSSTRQYLRPRSPLAVQTNSMLLSEVGAAVSVLLGFAPPSTVSVASSLKLNEVLKPNPFDRPRAVFLLEVKGVKVAQLMDDSVHALFSRSFQSRVNFGPSKANIQLPDEDQVSVISLNEPSSADSDAECTDKELSDFASWLDGSYVAYSLEPLKGELTIPLMNGAHLNLHMFKNADRKFTTSLVSLIRSIRWAADVHRKLSQSMSLPAELVKGSFDGIKALQEQYENEDIPQQGVELFIASISKIFGSLQEAYKGQLVGVLLFNEAHTSESETMLNLLFTSRPSPRWLEETKVPLNSTIVREVVLVRRTLAWVTGIILVIATLLGIHFLLNMPLTRDTLLYSNVKLD